MTDKEKLEKIKEFAEKQIKKAKTLFPTSITAMVVASNCQHILNILDGKEPWEE